MVLSEKNLICPNSDNIDRNFCATRQHLHHYRVQSWRWSVDSKPSEEQQLKRITARIATQNPVGTVTPCVVLPLPDIKEFDEIRGMQLLTWSDKKYVTSKRSKLVGIWVKTRTRSQTTKSKWISCRWVVNHFLNGEKKGIRRGGWAVLSSIHKIQQWRLVKCIYWYTQIWWVNGVEISNLFTNGCGTILN